MALVRIEQAIKDMEDYIATCKPAKFASNKVAVDIDVMDDFINELKQRLPEEVKNYKKMLMNKDQILFDARSEAEAIVNNARAERENLINNSDVLKQAYEIREQMIAESRETYNKTINEANEFASQIKAGALEYADTLLSNTAKSLEGAFGSVRESYSKLVDELGEEINTLNANRRELSGMDVGIKNDPLSDLDQ